MTDSLYIYGDDDRLPDLLGKYRQGLATAAEIAELEERLRQPGARDILALYNMEEEVLGLSDAELEKAIQDIEVNISHLRVVKKGHVWKLLLVAAIFTLMIAGVYLLVPHKPSTQQATATNNKRYQNDVPPGGNKAVLTLANGKQVILDDAANGSVAAEGNTQVIKLSSGMLAYQVGKSKGDAIAYNSITTPRAGQYTVVLPDGSTVWLNAASSLRFPVVFTGKQRLVEMTGEAYFEVAKNAQQPFVVKTNQQLVQVLGTNFNISAYPDEAQVSTTLLEGSVRVTSGEVTQQLIPGQQAQAIDNRIVLVKAPDLTAVMAWKNGIFYFNESTIQSILKEVARWYDVQVIYQNNHIQEHFMGNISRKMPLSEVLHLLELTGSVQFSIEGNKVIVR